MKWVAAWMRSSRLINIHRGDRKAAENSVMRSDDTAEMCLFLFFKSCLHFIFISRLCFVKSFLGLPFKHLFTKREKSLRV